MKNSEALRSLCNAMANTFYPDDSTISMMCFNEGVDAEAEATPKDVTIFRLALALVLGYVEGSRSENGVSTSVFSEKVKESVKYWCNIYGLDADEELKGFVRVVEDGSNLW